MLTHATVSRTLEISEISQSQKDKYMFALIRSP